MAWACHDPRREKCVTNCLRGVKKSVLNNLLDKGVNFMEASETGANEYTDAALCSCLLECLAIAQLIDQYQGWDLPGYGEHEKSTRRIALALLQDRAYLLGTSQPDSWQEIRELAATL